MLSPSQLELNRVLELTARVGGNPLLTQASTGNSSVKLDQELWVKASGKWMANALREEILIPLKLQDAVDCLRRGVDPAQRFPGVSVETALHAALPHRVVLHVHSVDAIAWAVRRDARARLKERLEGLDWKWVPYVASGLPLSREIARALASHPETSVFVLGNHGLVVAGEDAGEVEALLACVQQRLEIAPRIAPTPDYARLDRVCANSPWRIPSEDGVHALATDSTSQAILAGGLLYPCQAIFLSAGTLDLFRAIPYSDHGHPCYEDRRYEDRPFLILDGLGVVANETARRAEVATIAGLAQVVQRLSPGVPVRYLTQAEIAEISSDTAYRYRELANMSARECAWR